MIYEQDGHSAEYVSNLFYGHAIEVPELVVEAPAPHPFSLPTQIIEPHPSPDLPPVKELPLPSPTLAPDLLPPREPPLSSPSLPPDLPPPSESLMVYRPPLAPPLRLAPSATHVHGSIQARSPLYAVQDIVSVWGQHLQLFGEQVIWLPIEVCAYLLAHQPDNWQQMTVAPDSVTTSFDSGTGLDVLESVSTLTWGIDGHGQAYFTIDGDVGQNESAYCWTDQESVYLIQ